MRSTHKA